MSTFRQHSSLVGLGVAVLTVVSSKAHAESVALVLPELRQGYYVSGSIAAVGALTHADTGVPSGPLAGGGFSLRLGQALDQQLGIGLALDLASPRDSRRRGSYVAFGFDFHARLIQRLAVHAGVGLGVLQLVEPEDSEAAAEGTVGTNYTLGFSYDFFPWQDRGSGGWSVSPVAQARFLPGNDVGTTMVWVGIEVSWWSGLSRERLSLPIDEAYRQ